MSPPPGQLDALWRVGYHADPLGYTPWELYQFNHRFDDVRRRFRTVYCAQSPETCLREVLADFRPNLAAMRRHVERYGPEAAHDFTSEPVTARWRAQHVLVPVVLQLDGPLIDLTELPTRREVENRDIELLLEHGLEHLDLHEITTSRRVVAQTIAADLFDRGASAVRFPSRLDGSVCVCPVRGAWNRGCNRRRGRAHRPAARAALQCHCNVGSCAGARTARRLPTLT